MSFPRSAKDMTQVRKPGGCGNEQGSCSSPTRSLKRFGFHTLPIF